MMYNPDIPIIDIQQINSEEHKNTIARQINNACTNHGFFYISGHDVDTNLQEELMEQSMLFFQLPESEKLAIAMENGGSAWRGFFPVNAELTSGKPDKKEGLYFGTELPDSHPSVKAGVPLHGQNLFPHSPSGFGDTTLKYMDAVAQTGQLIMKGIALSLGLPEDYFYQQYTSDPFVLFRIFHYPPQQPNTTQWGVGEHTDYGLLTILLQDSVGGLQVKSNGKWIDAPPIPNTFICNIGDMLDRMTGGIYRSTPHRVLNTSGKSRLSFPLFFDPAFDSKIAPITNILESAMHQDSLQRWDKTNIHTFEGTYGEYLLQKIGKVFPGLSKDVL
jgi:isopenicillin N synthase-like dioxygenase